MGKKIVIIDDELDLLTVATFRLKRSGYEVLCAVDGKEGLNLVRQAMPDLVLLDLDLPIIHGSEVCRSIKDDASTRDIPVVFFAAAGDGRVALFTEQFGADDYIIKPFEPELLIAKTEELIKQKNSNLCVSS